MNIETEISSRCVRSTPRRPARQGPATTHRAPPTGLLSAAELRGLVRDLLG